MTVYTKCVFQLTVIEIAPTPSFYLETLQIVNEQKEFLAIFKEITEKESKSGNIQLVFITNFG